MAPNITEFNAPDLTLRPSETGVEATARAGLRLGAYGNQVAGALERSGQDIGRGIAGAGTAAYQYMEHRETSAGAANFAQMMVNLEQDWNNTAKNADPNDPSIAAKWRAETLEPALEKFHSSFLTTGAQDWAETRIDAFRQHLFTKTAADMSSLAADAAHVNVERTANGLTTAVYNDPSSLSFARDTLAHSLDGIVASSPNMSATDAAKVKTELTQKVEEQLVKNAIMGTIVKGGDWRTIANDPKNAPYVNAPEAQQFERAQRMYQRMDEAETRNARVMKDYTDRQNWNQAADKLELSTLPEKSGDPPVLPDNYWDQVKKIGVMPGTDPARLRSLIDNGERLTNKLGKPEPLGPISHATTMDLLAGIRSGTVTSTDDIYKAYGDNKLNNADFNFLQHEWAERKTPEGERLDKDRDLFFKRYGLMLDPTMGIGPYPAGRTQPLYEAEMDARQQEQTLRAKGLDPHLVYDPRSEYFFGKAENIQKYKQPLQSRLPGPPPAVETRKVGQVYPTPRGPMQWTGTGWIPPGNAPSPPIRGEIIGPVIPRIIEALKEESNKPSYLGFLKAGGQDFIDDIMNTLSGKGSGPSFEHRKALLSRE